MSLSGKQWIWPDQDRALAEHLTKDPGISPALARLLVNRGITDPAEAGAFLYPSFDHFHSPWALAGMAEAIERLLAALNRDEKIVIHGDYDADGIAATAILVETLHCLGGRVDYHLPSRFEEGYGLHLEPLKAIKEAGAALVVTVDCGINAVEEVGWASANGLDMIITDHHQPLMIPAEAVAVINPHQKDCSYPFKELSGAGVAFKMASALMEKAEKPFPEQLLDLAALGTTADVVPLLGENRAIVHHGLKVLRQMDRIGFKALAEAVGLERDRITSTTLAFILAPAINAAGRMGEALPAAQILLEDNPARAQNLAETLKRANQLRRNTEQKILLQAEEAAINYLAAGDQRVITLAGENWHHGVIGIVAARLVEKYNHPFCLIALEGEEGRGSVRSIKGFDITAALTACSSSLEKFGGHEQAAGFTVRVDQVEALRKGLNRYAALNLRQSDLKPRLFIEAELDDAEISCDFTDCLDQMQPFGTANPVPLFASRSWEIQSWRLVGSDQKHLKLQVKKGSRGLNAIFFSGSFLEPHLEKGRRVDLAFKLKNGFFKNQKTLDVEVKDLAYSDNVKNGNLEIIDLRHNKNRLALACDILDRNGRKSVVFTSTGARSKEIKDSYFGEDLPFFVASGFLNKAKSLPSDSNSIILYDLPLYKGLIEPLFADAVHPNPLTVYLIYGHHDLKRNQRLMDLSLPSEKNLKTIIAALVKNPAAFPQSGYSGLELEVLDYKPVASFWERCEKIFGEIGLIQEGNLAPGWQKVMDDWPACLKFSPTFKNVKTIREQCKQFQELLLNAAPLELAAFFTGLAKD